MRHQVFAIAETARLRSSTRTVLLKTAVTTADLDDSVRKTEVYYFAKNFAKMIAESDLVRNDRKEA